MKRKDRKFLQVITTETQYSGITYFIGDNRVNQEATLTLPVVNSTIKWVTITELLIMF